MRGQLVSGTSQMLRLDLIVLTPILYLLTAAAVYSIYRQLGKKK